MIQVKYKGRLGNQLFQYCFGRILAEELGWKLAAEPIAGFPRTEDAVPGKEFADHNPLVFSGVDRPDLQELLRNPPGRRIFLHAYFQVYQYYSPYLDRIRQWLALDEYDRRQFFTGPETLVINLRLGDYLDCHWALAPDFFLRCLEFIPHESLVIVTDSPRSNYLRHFDRFRPRIIHEDPLTDFKWLVNASNLVLSQSTFSWWAAQLSDAEVWMPETRDSLWSTCWQHMDLFVRDQPRWHILPAEPLPRGHAYVAEP